MALNAYFTIKGLRQGRIKGSVTQKGRSGSILVFGVDHLIVSPRDAASGLPTGQRQHKPITILKELDAATVPLYSALVTDENLPEWELKFWRPTSAGIETQYFTIKFTNANVSSINLIKPDTKNHELQGYLDHEELDFTYQKIEWIWKDGGITASDDGEAPVT